MDIPDDDVDEVALRNHRDKVKRSEGFDADVILDGYLDGYIVDVRPCRFNTYQFNQHLDDLKHCCDLAILDYNTKQKTNLKVVDVVQANYDNAYRPEGDGYGFDFYISFTAVEESSGAAAAPAPYQAKVFSPWSFCKTVHVVKFCRPKPGTSS